MGEKVSKERMQEMMEYQKQNIKRIPFDVQRTYYNEVLKPAADAAGMRMNEFIKAAIAEKIERENLN